MAGQFTAYRSSALQANLQPAQWENPSDPKDYRIKEGAVWINVANGIPGKEKSWDWTNKIVWKVITADIETILAGWVEKDGTKSISLFHKDQNEVNNTLRIQPGSNNTYALYFNKGDIKVPIYLSKGQWIVFCKLLSDSYADIIGWRLTKDESGPNF